MLRRKEARVVVYALAGLLIAATGSVWGKDMAFHFDLTTLKSTYTAGSGPNGVVGTLTIRDDNKDYGSGLAAAKLDLGNDGLLGGGGGDYDIELDLAQIDTSNLFEMEFVGTVVKLGTNSYRIEGPLKITDTTNSLSAPQFAGWFTSSFVSVDYGFLQFTGSLSPWGSNDSLLLPGPGDSWVFDGVPGNTALSPNQDGVVGRISLDDRRTCFSHGIYAGGGDFGFFSGNMDAWFSGNRSSETINVQAAALPEPATVLLVLMGFAILGRKVR